MADGVRVDDSQVRRLAADLGRVPVKTVPAIDAVMRKGATNVKETMRADASGHSTFPHFPNSITFDRVLGIGIGYEIGPDKDLAQGALGNILYFGTSNNAPVLDVEHGMRQEAPKLEKNLAEVAAGLLGL